MTAGESASGADAKDSDFFQDNVRELTDKEKGELAKGSAIYAEAGNDLVAETDQNEFNP